MTDDAITRSSSGSYPWRVWGMGFKRKRTAIVWRLLRRAAAVCWQGDERPQIESALVFVRDTTEGPADATGVASGKGWLYRCLRNAGAAEPQWWDKIEAEHSSVSG